MLLAGCVGLGIHTRAVALIGLPWRERRHREEETAEGTGAQ